MSERISADDWRKHYGLPAVGNNAAVPAAYVQRAAGRKSKKADITEDAGTRVYGIRVHCRRRGSTDVCNASHKAAVDGLVQAAVLPDDSRKYQPLDPIYTEEKCAKGEESTRIEVHAFDDIAGLSAWYSGEVQSVLAALQ